MASPRRIAGMKLFTLLFGLALLAPAHAHRVIAIEGGDTLVLMVNEKPLKIGLANIDAPEKAQPFGERSKQSLSDLCLRKDALYKEQDIDRYGRILAVVTCDGVEANRTQIELGMAWVYVKYNRDLLLPGLEAMARRDRRGLWADAEPTPPWEFRQPKIKKVSRHSSKASVEGICFIDRYGEYALVEGVKRYGC